MESGVLSEKDEAKRLDQAIADALRILCSLLRQFAVEQRLSTITKCRALLDALETEAIASQLDAGVPTRKVEDTIHRSAGGGASKKTVKQKTRRAATTQHNPTLAKRMASGDISAEQMDVLASASDKTNGAAAQNTELINKVAAAPPEQGKKLAHEFVRKQQTQGDIDTAYQRARKRRKVIRYSNPDRGTDTLAIEGAPADIDEIEARLDKLADKFYRNDGGRDIDHGKHRRTSDQRRFDAAHQLITGSDNEPETPTDEPISTKRTANRAPKPVVVIRASLDQAQGTDTSPITLADGKPLPTSIVERLACEAEFIGQIYGAEGEILWQGRKVRHATAAQRTALTIRDGGCVRCQAAPDRCVAHHLKPWHSRMQGQSNIDEMAFVCDDCHHHIHDNELTLYKDDGGVWKLRAAVPEEIPPDGRLPVSRKPKRRPDRDHASSHTLHTARIERRT